MFSLDKDKIKIVLLEGVHHNAIDVFNNHGYANVKNYRSSLNDSELIEIIHDAFIVGIRSRTKLNDTVLQEAKLWVLLVTDILAARCPYWQKH